MIIKKNSRSYLDQVNKWINIHIIFPEGHHNDVDLYAYNFNILSRANKFLIGYTFNYLNLFPGITIHLPCILN